MQESNKPTNEEAFWKSPQESVEVGLEHLAEDKELEVSQVKAKFRHRLVGAVVLVAALATVLPIFFEEPAIQSDRHAETKIPPITKEPFYKMELPVNNRPAVSMPADQSALKDLSKPNVVKDAPEARPTPELDQKQNVEQSYVPSTEGSLYIQVLATSSEAGAMREMARYQAMGLPVYSVKVQKKSATLWRVRLGLFKTKEEAERVAKVLDSRKISHMPVQVEESAKRDMNRIAPTRTLKSAAQEAHSRSQEQKAKTPAAQPAKAKSQPIKNATPAQPKAVKPATAAKTSQPVKKETAPKATQKVSSKKSASDDPLADLLKSTREDVIAQKLRESGHK
ncbi:SPOR domain-containing protein [Parasutterella secunda]|uniref:SPOR domain-containing protein n=1 Tax=Parasutterella secunda TaxID=626947 RepID=UPI0025A32AEC|nr:SPOR domain-containing protein [Parasutterella secunda]MDM8226255.1 SPOR domain-containing protein [Parasutterella secunda]